MAEGGNGSSLDKPAASPAEEKALTAEKRIAIVRALVITFNVAAYYFLLPEGTGIPWLAATISVVARTMVTVPVT